jgi:hypothetical protein
MGSNEIAHPLENVYYSLGGITRSIEHVDTSTVSSVTTRLSDIIERDHHVHVAKFEFCTEDHVLGSDIYKECKPEVAPPRNSRGLVIVLITGIYHISPFLLLCSFFVRIFLQ